MGSGSVATGLTGLVLALGCNARQNSDYAFPDPYATVQPSILSQITGNPQEAIIAYETPLFAPGDEPDGRKDVRGMGYGDLIHALETAGIDVRVVPIMDGLYEASMMPYPPADRAFLDRAARHGQDPARAVIFLNEPPMDRLKDLREIFNTAVPTELYRASKVSGNITLEGLR